MSTFIFSIIIIHLIQRGWHGMVEVTNKLVALYPYLLHAFFIALVGRIWLNIMIFHVW